MVNPTDQSYLDQVVKNLLDICRSEIWNISDESFYDLIICLFLLRKDFSSSNPLEFLDKVNQRKLPESLLMFFKESETPAEIYEGMVRRASKERISKKTVTSIINVLFRAEFNEIDLKWMLNRIFDLRITNGGMRTATTASTSTSTIKSLFARFGGLKSSGEFFDPFFGESSFLSEHVIQNFNIHGYEINEAVFEHARAYLYLYEKDYSFLKQMDSMLGPIKDIAFKPKSADLIMTAPPFGMKMSDSQLDELERDVFRRFPHGLVKAEPTWNIIQNCLYSLNDNGMGFALVPLGSLVSSGLGGKIREDLIVTGKIKAVISLPGGLIPVSSAPSAILYFTNEPILNGVKFISAEILEVKRDGKERFFDEPEVDKIISAFLSPESIEGFSKTIKTDEILENNGNLSPQRYIQIFRSETSDYQMLEAQLNQAKEAADRALFNINEMMKNIKG